MLVVGKRQSVFESAVICEYLNEVTPGSLHPEDPLERADHRAWIEFGSGLLSGIAQLYNAPTQEEFDTSRKMLRARFGQLEKRLGSGPYFAGENFYIIDAVYGPIFRYFDVFESVMDLGILEDVEKVHMWRGHLRARESVRKAVTFDYTDRLLAFVRKRGSCISQKIKAL